MITPKTHLFLNSTFANQKRQHGAQPEPYVVVHPDDAPPRGLEDGARGACSTTAARSCAPRGCPTTPAPAWSWPRWAGGAATTRAGWAAQATTSQRLTEAGAAPTFNDNRVELAPAPPG